MSLRSVSRWDGPLVSFVPFVVQFNGPEGLPHFGQISRFRIAWDKRSISETATMITTAMAESWL